MKWAWLVVLFALAACDESEAFRPPHPSWERMQTQERVDPFGAEPMQAPPHDTVAREDELEEIPTPPRPVDAALLEEGRDHFDRICAACHGISGDGTSVVATKMIAHPPTSLVDGEGAATTTEYVYGVVRDGKGWMPGFAHELTSRERWATAFYLQALRLSRHAVVSDLPPAVRSDLERSTSP